MATKSWIKRLDFLPIGTVMLTVPGGAIDKLIASRPFGSKFKLGIETVTKTEFPEFHKYRSELFGSTMADTIQVHPQGVGGGSVGGNLWVKVKP